MTCVERGSSCRWGFDPRPVLTQGPRQLHTPALCFFFESQLLPRCEVLRTRLSLAYREAPGSLSGLRTMNLVLSTETPDQLQGLMHTPERALAPDAALLVAPRCAYREEASMNLKPTTYFIM